MAIDNSFMIKKIEKFEYLYVLFNQQMGVPFIECDEQTFDDQVYVYTTEEMAQNGARPYTQDKILLQVLKIPNKVFDGFFQGLYNFGINAVMVQDEGAPVRVQLDQLTKKPDLEAMKSDQIPRSNPELQLTAVYFMQELRRPLERNQEEKMRLHNLEEEMAHNLLRSRFIITFDTTNIKGKWDPKDKSQKVKIPLIKSKDGKVFQPVYTDFSEFQKFNAKNKGMKLNLTAVPYDQLKNFLVKESLGFAFNPGGFNLVLTKEQMEQMQSRYAES